MSGLRHSRQPGFSLVELVVAIVVISVGLAGVLVVYHQVTARSADPLLQQQAQAIAAAYLEEVLLHAYDASCGAPSAAQRRDYTRVCDYAGLDELGARDRNGAPIAGLEPYRVRVSVTPVTEELGPAGATVPALRVEVAVSHSGASTQARLVGYRAGYP